LIVIGLNSNNYYNPLHKPNLKPIVLANRLKTILTLFSENNSESYWLDKSEQILAEAIKLCRLYDDNYVNFLELHKLITMPNYYKEKIEYIFYDTLKTDTANIGIAEELKKTATILSNLAQNFNIFICSTLQLLDSTTPPINLDVNDLSACKTVKEVLDTLCLMKQINRENLKDYEYSLQEVDSQFYDIENDKNPDVRYYACVIDKNRAGAKPKLLFRINLAYNSWEELGYLKLKQS